MVVAAGVLEAVDAVAVAADVPVVGAADVTAAVVAEGTRTFSHGSSRIRTDRAN